MLLCTPIQLADRRTVFSRDIHISRNPSDDNTHLASTMRPCVLRSLSSKDGDDRKKTRSASKGSQSRSAKPSLVVFSLDMQPGTKTLAQSSFKRDPVKLPFFCKQYNHSKKSPSSSPLSKDKAISQELMVRGVEILHDQYPSSPAEPDDSVECHPSRSEDIYIPEELQIQLTNCCECMRDVNLIKRELQISQLQLMNESDSYLIVNGNKGNTLSEDRERQCVPLVGHRPAVFSGKGLTADPNTRRIIHVTMNNKNYKKSGLST